jgi:hypothetical protein
MKIFSQLVLTAILATGCAHAQKVERSSSIGYPTVAAALADLKSNPNASVREQEGWTIIRVQEGEKQSAIWSFSPIGYPAYPAAVKRTIYEQDGVVMMKTNALCQASKVECDKLMEQFNELEQRIRDRMQNPRSGT